MAFDPQEAPPSLREVAQAAGVNPSTASRALRGLPGVAPPTVERICTVARRMGYRPDRDLASLATYRQRKASRSTAVRVAVVLLRRMRHLRPIRGYLTGLAEASGRLGLDCTTVEAPESGPLTELIMAEKASGCRAIVLACQNRDRLDPVEIAACEGLVVVIPDYLIPDQCAYRVTVDFFNAMRESWRRLVTLGYRRIGLCLPERTDRNSSGLWSAAYHWCQHRAAEGQDALLPICHAAAGDPDRIDAWIAAHRPDVIISRKSLRSYFDLRRLPVPEAMGYLSLAADPAGGTAGPQEHSTAVGRYLALHIDELLRHRRFGIPLQPTVTMLPAPWHPGASIHQCG